MNHEANTIQWKVGDLVLHDADRKADYMLMKVIKIQKNGLYITQYISEYMKQKWQQDSKKKWKNDVRMLHDPARFDVSTDEFVNEYYIICLEQPSYEDSLLFWKPKGFGYTSSLEEAGRFSEEFAKNINTTGRDIALKKDEIDALPGMRRKLLLCSPLSDLRALKEKLKEEEK